MMESLGMAAKDGPAMGVAFEAFLNPMELTMARRFVGDMAPEDAQEEVHAWHLAASHLLAAQRIGKSRQDGLSQRAEQIEVGLAVRLMALADRKSASLDRHRAFRLKAADEAEQRARARAYREADETKRAVEAAERAERAAWRGICATQRVPDDGQGDDDGQQGLAADRQEGPEAAGDGKAAPRPAPALDAPRPAPAPSEAEAAALPAWEQAIEASRPARDEEEDAEATRRGPVRAPGSGHGSGPGASPGSGPGSMPGVDSGTSPLTRQQRRAMERREKKAARRAAAIG